MSQHRIKKWDDRAKTYLGLPAKHRAEFRMQFRKQPFDAAVVRVGTHLNREYKRLSKMMENRSRKEAGNG